MTTARTSPGVVKACRHQVEPDIAAHVTIDELMTHSGGTGDVFLPDFDSQWDDPALRQELMGVARRLESEASIIGASAHLLGVARKS